MSRKTKAKKTLDDAQETLARAREGNDEKAIEAAEKAVAAAEDAISIAEGNASIRDPGAARNAQEVKEAAALEQQEKLDAMRAEARRVKTGDHTHVVVKGKSVTSLRGIKAEGEGVSASSFSGGEGSLTKLVGLGVVEKV